MKYNEKLVEMAKTSEKYEHVLPKVLGISQFRVWKNRRILSLSYYGKTRKNI